MALEPAARIELAAYGLRKHCRGWKVACSVAFSFIFVGFAG